MSDAAVVSGSLRLLLLLALLVVSLAAPGCGGSSDPDTVTLVIDGTKAREGVAGGGGATVGNTLILGDSGTNVSRVALVSFSLANLPAGVTVERATLAVHQLGVTSGSPYPDLGVLVVDSVDLGAGVDATDATSVALIPSIGTLSTTGSVGDRSLDVMAAVLADIAAARTRSELRIRFSIPTDGDSQQDTIQIRETGSSSPETPPTLVIVYRP